MIGRKDEMAIFSRLLESQKPELVLITGRRRVGKTFLVREGLKQSICFEFVGTQQAELKNQLDKFTKAIGHYFPGKGQYLKFTNWAGALEYLGNCIDGLRKSRKKIVIFFDEFPWIAHHKSNFTREFGYWWNSWASKKNVIVVISGSATSWMIKKIINDKGGLHNRVTRKIHLQPFTLQETQQFLKSKKISHDPYQVMQLYMAVGGVPHYLEQVEAGESVSQSISRMCFSANGALRDEFKNLYKALFESYENYVLVVRALAKKWKGMTRQEIANSTKIADGGGLTKVLDDLESCSFILKIRPIGKKSKDILYRLIDEYSLFYLYFIEGSRASNREGWLQKSGTQEAHIWQGYAFENLCMRHQEAIKSALGISGIYSEVSSFYKKSSKQSKGFQIDMIIDRTDQAINLCEIKYYNKPVTIDKSTATLLRTRRENFREYTHTTKSLFNTLIAPYGIQANEHSNAQVDQVIKGDALFELKRF